MSADSDNTAIDPVIDVSISGRTFSIRPSFDACRRVEASLAMSLGQVSQTFALRHYGPTMIARIIYEGIRAGGGDRLPEFEEVGAEIVRRGADEFAVPALDFVTAALRGFERFNAAKLEDQAAAAQEENPT